MISAWLLLCVSRTSEQNQQVPMFCCFILVGVVRALRCVSRLLGQHGRVKYPCGGSIGIGFNNSRIAPPFLMN